MTSDDDDNLNDSSFPAPYATTREKYLNGLLQGKKKSQKNAAVGFDEGSGRSAFARRNFKPGHFVCEYQAVVRRKEKIDHAEMTNAELGLGCYCLNAIHNQEAYTFDATSKHNVPGRYINHT